MERFRNLIPVVVLFAVITVIIFAMAKVNLFWPLFYIPLFIAAYTYNEAGGLGVAIAAAAVIFGALYVAPPEEGAAFSELIIEFSAAAVVMMGTGVFVGWLSRMQKRKLVYFRDTSMVDKLTGLHNYGYFWERLEEERKRADRFGSRLALIMVDVDNFKTFNDRFGHATGNLLLQKLARILEENIRDIDIVCRYGSEEFAVLLPNTDKEAERVAERIRRATDEACFEGDKDEPVVKATVSAGLAVYPTSCDNELELIDKADAALSFAKQNGRNQVAVYDASVEAARK